MKFTLSRREIGRLQGRITKYVKKSKDTRRFLLTMLAIWLVIPVLTVNAADSSPVIVSAAETNVSLDANLQSATTPFGVEIRQSPHDEVLLANAKKVSTQVVVAQTSTETTDPGYDVKMQWAQKAAATWGMDWKVLAAVWQIETGQTWYTSRGSSAGARGPCQFMPGTWRAYAQDGNGDGTKNMYDARDCLFASAKLLATNGASSGNIDGALLRYNHSLAYVAKVKRIIASIGG